MENMQPKENKMGILPEGKLLFGMSVPLCISMLVQALYNIVDSIFVSRINENALTAVSLAYPIQMLMIAFAVGTGVGINALISRRLGEHRFEEAELAANNGLFVLFLTSLVFTAIGLFLSRPFMNAFTDVQQIRDYGTTYLTICCALCFGVFMQIGCERILQSQGQNTASMVMQLIGAVTNIVFDPILIFGLLGFPKLGIAGAAYATVLGQIVSMIACFIVLFVKKYEIRPSLKKFRLDGQTIRDIYQVGFPSIVMQSVGTVMNLCMNAILIAYSTTAVAVFGVYFKLQSVFFMPCFGITNASMSIMAYNYGAQKKSRIMRTWKLTVLSSAVIMIIGTLCFELFPEALLKLFDASDDMCRIGRPALRVLGTCFPFAAMAITNSTLFQSVGKGFYSLLVSLIRQLAVLVPAAFILSAVFRSEFAVWFSFPIAEVASLVTSFLLFLKVKRDLIDPLPDL